MPKLSEALAKAAQLRSSRKPVWEGPNGEGPNGGITQSLLGRFLACRERFRLRVVEGFKVDEGFSARLEYGNMIHVCEEATAANILYVRPLTEYCKQLVRTYGAEASREIDKWFQIAKVQYPIYLDFWKKHPDEKARKPIYQEEEFDVRYRLPSGRIVRLRGKWDSVDEIKRLVWLKENKAKGEIKEEQLRNELHSDLQTGMYLVALLEDEVLQGKFKLGGVRYNVLRRPLSGMKYNIKQKKGMGKAKKGAETTEEFYKRLGKVIEENSKDFFVRFRIEVTLGDIERFKQRILNPILEQLVDWWESIEHDPFNPWTTGRRWSEGYGYEKLNLPNHLHFQYPTGVYNPLLEGRASDLDRLIQTGDERGLIRTDNLFPELTRV